LGAAILGAVAAGSDQGGYDEIQAAVTQMGGLKGARYRPQPEQVALYDQLYADYRQLAQFFGERGHGVMGRLRNLRRAAHQRINMASPKL
jgi:L-ribulokinase